MRCRVFVFCVFVIRDQPAIQLLEDAKDAIQPKGFKRMISRYETFRLSASRAVCTVW